VAAPRTDYLLLPSPEEAARLLGGDVYKKAHVLCPGPGHSENDRSLSIKFDANAPDGFIVKSFTGDDALACKDYIRDVLGLPVFGSRRRVISVDHAAIARRRAEAQAQAATESEKRIGKSRGLWSHTRPILGSPAEKYLRNGRNLTVVPPALRFLPARGDFPPAMVAAYGLPTEPEPGTYQPLKPDAVQAVHITRLQPDGSDRERGDRAKIMVGRPGPHPIALIPPNDLGGLLVAEGVETGLSYAHLGLGIWAAGSKDRLVTIAPAIAALTCIDCVTISPDEDDPARVGITSAQRAEELAEKLIELRPDIEVRIA
jgi:hypothetical protein